MRKPEAPPEPRKVRREGEPGGGPEVAFDLERRQNYHLNTLGERVYHGIPAGYAFDDQGRIQPLPAPPVP